MDQGGEISRTKVQIVMTYSIAKYREQITCTQHYVSDWVKQIAFDSMTNHRFVTPDHLVQEAEFSSGRGGGVNFGKPDYVLANGQVARGREFVIFQCEGKKRRYQAPPNVNAFAESTRTKLTKQTRFRQKWHQAPPPVTVEPCGFTAAPASDSPPGTSAWSFPFFSPVFRSAQVERSPRIGRARKPSPSPGQVSLGTHR